jgi:hypothetical protein
VKLFGSVVLMMIGLGLALGNSLPDEGFSVKEYEAFHHVLHPLEHEALPRNDVAQIRASAPELFRLGKAIVRRGVPESTDVAKMKEFKSLLAKFDLALNQFRSDSRRRNDDRLKEAFSAVHDSFEMLVPLLPQRRSSSTTGNSTYYTVRRDPRRCASPMCGGYWVKQVNQPLTRCVDGTSKSECYVAGMEWNREAQVNERKALLRGEIEGKKFSRGETIGVLRVSESWEATNEVSQSGTYYRVRDRGLRCITFPCETHFEAKLNSNATGNIAGVDITKAGASDEDVAEANKQMTGSNGVLVMCSHAPVKGPGGRSVTLKATRFYLKR